MFLETCRFLLGCPFHWHITVRSIFLWHFCSISCYFSSLIFLHFLFCLFGASLFFLISLARASSILFILSKHQLLVLLIFFYRYFISSLIFTITFLLLISGFVYSYFSNFFRWKIRLFIWKFSFSSSFFFFFLKACIAVNFPLRTVFSACHRFCMVVFSLSLVPQYFLISSLISLLIHWFL